MVGSVVNEVILDDGGEQWCSPCASLDCGLFSATPESKSHGASLFGSILFATLCNCSIDQYFAINTLHLCSENVAGKLQDLLVLHDVVRLRTIKSYHGDRTLPRHGTVLLLAHQWRCCSSPTPVGGW